MIIPVKNEEATLTATLDAFRAQRNYVGETLPFNEYEVLLLLNNCIDHSAEIACGYANEYPGFRLHVFECELLAERAHVGTARKALMDLACDRLDLLADGTARAILSTDADTIVAQDWITQNLLEIEAGAEVVGGVIHLFPEDLASLDHRTRLAYERDRELQQLVARLESLLDPDPNDVWPRHLEHFGASLACTPEIYRRSGGLPPVTPLEDVAFIDALRKSGARIRHATTVHIATSARMDGRARVGLSGQLRLWQQEQRQGLPQIVDSPEWLAHRFSSMARMRRLNEDSVADDLGDFPYRWQEHLRACLAKRLATPRFLEVLDCDRLIEEMFEGLSSNKVRRHAEITETILGLRERIASFDPQGPGFETKN